MCVILPSGSLIRPRSKLRWMPWAGLLLYAQVLKSYRRLYPRGTRLQSVALSTVQWGVR
jgi:hypothetical protein